jgi:hypothetical protein
MKKLSSAILNIEAGNHELAQEVAKPYSCWKIMSTAEELGYTNPVHYTAIAAFLKGVIDFQKYSDTMTKSERIQLI